MQSSKKPIDTAALHTPGPWTRRAPTPSQWPEHSIVGKAGGYVASVQIRAHNPARGDADLIAAAPDLLAALQQLQAFVGVMFGDGPDATIPNTVRTPIGIPVKIGEIMDCTKAALAKAGVR